MRFFWIFVVILLVISPVSSQSHRPEITNNNPTYLEEFINPITLNWTVQDDNLRQHQILINRGVVDIHQYNYSEMRTIEITLEFNLGNGRYNITLQVSDADGYNISDSFELLKGEEPAELPRIPFPHIGFTVIPIVLISLGTKYYRQRRYNY